MVTVCSGTEAHGSVSQLILKGYFGARDEQKTLSARSLLVRDKVTQRSQPTLHRERRDKFLEGKEGPGGIRQPLPTALGWELHISASPICPILWVTILTSEGDFERLMN